MANLSGGMSNNGIVVVLRDGVQVVERKYQQDWLITTLYQQDWLITTLPEEKFYEDVQKMFKEDFLVGPEHWSWTETDENEVTIANPFVEVLDIAAMDREAKWSVYEEILEKLTKLIDDSGLAIMDTHSGNHKYCRVEGEPNLRQKT